VTPNGFIEKKVNLYMLWMNSEADLCITNYRIEIVIFYLLMISSTQTIFI